LKSRNAIAVRFIFTSGPTPPVHLVGVVLVPILTPLAGPDSHEVGIEVAFPSTDVDID
jgi:hypothetical protein